MEGTKSVHEVLSKNKIKLVRSLDLKKNRLATGLFVAEGKKLVFDLLHSATEIHELFTTKQLSADLIRYKSDVPFEIIEKEELEKISFLKTTPEIVGLFKIPYFVIDWNEIRNSLTLALDAIQDPGNLGTIVRLADWFGIRNIVCSQDCTDLFNPKTVQATMGALARVKVHSVLLPGFLNKAVQYGLPIYGTFLEGDNIYQCELDKNGIIVMGNEGKGISKQISEFISKKIVIPPYPPGSATSESLNVAIATSIVCSEFRRRIL